MKRILLFLFICLTVFIARAQTPTVLTFSSNAAPNWADGIAQDGEGGSTNISGTNIQILNINSSGVNVGKPIEWLNSTQLATTHNFTGLTTIDPDFDANGWAGIAIKSADGKEFQINQFQWYDWMWTGGSVMVRGYLDGTPVASSSFIANSTDIILTVTLNNNFDNVDEVRIIYNSGSGWGTINNIEIADAVSANLSNLSISAGTLSPVFASGTNSYTASVSAEISSITVTPTKENVNAVISVNGTLVASGNASGNISLNMGLNTITVLVSAVNGTTKTYTLGVTRLPIMVTNVSSPSTKLLNKKDDNLTIAVTFSGNVTVVGTPTISLNSGGTAYYASGSGTSEINFNYQVAAGNQSSDLDYSATNSLSLAGGTIKDGGNTNVVLTLPTPGTAGSLGANKDFVIDGIVPTISSIVRTGVTPTNASSVAYVVTFSESVTGVGISDFTVTPTGTAAGTIASLNGSGDVYTITINASGEGTLRLDLNSSGTDIQDAATNAIAGGFTSGGVYTIDRIAPTLTPVTIASNNVTTSKAKVGDVITLNFTASESIPIPTVTLGGIASIPTNTGGNNWTATHTEAGPTPEGILVFNIVFSDLIGNAGISVTATTNSSSVTVDRTAPASPTGLAATPGDTQNVITWNASTTPDLDKYILYGGTTTNPTTAVQTISAGTLSYTHTGLSNGTDYFYRIAAADLTGNESAKSGNIVSVPKGTQTITFNALAASTYGAGTITLTATSSSGLPIIYTSSNTAVATVLGSTVTILAAGTTTITASQAGNSAFFVATPVSQDLVVNKKDIAVTAVAKNKIYGAADPAFTYAFSPALIGTDTFIGALGRTAGEDVGFYGINQGTVVLNANYTITFTSANLQVTAKPITVTATAKTKIYGDIDPAFTYTVAPALIGMDAYTGTLDRAPGESIGNYAISQGSLTAGSNYLITYVPANLSIGTKTISVAATAANKTYGGADPVLAYTFSPTLIGTDTFSGSLSRATGENIGVYAINKNTLVLSSNYVLNYTPANLTIGKAALSIIAEDKEKFIGTANPTFTVKYTGLVNGETGAVLTTPATLSTTAITNSPIGTYDIVPSGAVAANYQISYVNGKLTVKPGAPTNVLFAGTILYENKASGTTAGTLSSTSDDPLATFTYSLVIGSGDTDNALFSISGNQLLTAVGLDYENKTAYSVRVRSTTQYGFSLDKTFTINLSDVNEIPTLAVIANQTICYTTTAQSINLTGINAGPEVTQSTSISVAGNNSALLQSLTVSGSGATAIINYSVKTGASGTATITVTVKDNGGTANGGVDTYSRTFVLSVNTLPAVLVTADKGTSTGNNSIEVSKGETVFLNATGGAIYAWANHSSIVKGLNTSTVEVRPRETTTYTVTATNASGCAETQNFTIMVLDDMAKVKANNIMSPNGDGVNDKWLIDNIDFYPNNEVKVFDKSGRLMYSKKGYDNSWDGTLNGTPLTEDTYYYVIDFGQDKAKVKGFITIIRSS